MIRIIPLVIMSIITTSSYAQQEPQPKAQFKSNSNQNVVLTKSVNKTVMISKKAGEEQVVHNEERDRLELRCKRT